MRVQFPLERQAKCAVMRNLPRNNLIRIGGGQRRRNGFTMRAVAGAQPRDVRVDLDDRSEMRELTPLGVETVQDHMAVHVSTLFRRRMGGKCACSGARVVTLSV